MIHINKFKCVLAVVLAVGLTACATDTKTIPQAKEFAKDNLTLAKTDSSSFEVSSSMDDSSTASTPLPSSSISVKEITSSAEKLIEESSSESSSIIDGVKHEGKASQEQERTETVYEYYDDWFWVGDSRIVGMAGNVGISYLAKSAMGLDWFLENEQTVYDLRGCNVVFNLGINDYWNVYNYANVYNSMPEEFIQNNKIFIMSINPVDESKAGYLDNYNYEWFNENLRINLREELYFIDCYSYLQDTGFGTIDGIHYDGATNVKIHDYVIGIVTGQNIQDL